MIFLSPLFQVLESLKMVLCDLSFWDLGELIQSFNKFLGSAYYVCASGWLWGYSAEQVCSLPPWRTAQILQRQHPACRCQMDIVAEKKSNKDETTGLVVSIV